MLCAPEASTLKLMKLTFVLLLLLAFTSHGARAQARRGMTPADTLGVAAVADAQVAPGGGAVVYTVSTAQGDATRTSLWIVAAGDVRGAPMPLLPAGWEGTNPRWSPDGRLIAFLSVRDKQPGLWVVSRRDRQPRLVAPLRTTNFFIAYAGEPFAWSPDSRRLAYVSASEATDDAADTGRDAATATPSGNVADARGDDPRVIDRIQYKSRTAFSDRLRTHVWVTEVDRPAPRQLTSGATYDHALTFSPRGDEIAFLSNHEPDPDALNNSDIFAVNLEGRVRRLTETGGCEYDPQWSPDGKWIAYLATTRDVTTIDSVAEDAHVWVIDANGGRGRDLTAAQDRRARSPRWAADSNTLFFLAGDRGQTLIYRVNLSGAQVQNVFERLGVTELSEDKTAERRRPVQVANFSFARGGAFPRPPANGGPLIGTLAFTQSDALHPAEVWTYLAANAPLKVALPLYRHSSHNDPLMRLLSLVEPEVITFKSFDDTRIQGWLMKPVGWREGERYPLILSVHGGPHGMYGYGFNATFQAYAARGYAVLFVNPRGSSGYGQKFSDGTLREWGGGDYRDLMAGVDEALRRFPWLDRNRLGVTGGSYGGFMTNWIITQTPRFRAAVASASVSNLVSFYATSLYQDLIHAEFGGAPWDDFDLLWRWSPIRYVASAQTPTLFLHGEQDNDVHVTQAEEMYMALRRRGVETVLVRYPREGHSLREPRHRQDALERTLAWFDKYLK